MGGKHSRNKGAGFERWVARKFKAIFPNVRRHLEFQREEAALGIDLVHLGRYRVQCKALARYAPITCINEVKIDPIEGGCPVLITKGDRLEPMVVLPFDEFLWLLKRSER